MDLKEVVYEDVDWIRPIQSRVQWRAVMNTGIIFRVP
jgi:hypothetical protein